MQPFSQSHAMYAMNMGAYMEKLLAWGEEAAAVVRARSGLGEATRVVTVHATFLPGCGLHRSSLRRHDLHARFLCSRVNACDLPAPLSRK